jgi:hypothetical protein
VHIVSTFLLLRERSKAVERPKAKFTISAPIWVKVLSACLGVWALLIWCLIKLI